MRGDLLDWRERGDFVQLGSRVPGQIELCIGSDDGLTAVELSPGACHALVRALDVEDEEERIEDAVDAALEPIYVELEDVTEERDRLADEVAQLREQLTEARAGRSS